MMLAEPHTTYTVCNAISLCDSQMLFTHVEFKVRAKR